MNRPGTVPVFRVQPPGWQHHADDANLVTVQPMFEPMLATSGRPAGDLAGWVAEPKLDGWRAQVHIDPSLPGGRTVRTRSGRDITSALPELESVAELGVSVVLDGELVAGAGRLSDFYRVGPSMARRDRRDCLSFAAFDVLWCEGEPVTEQPYTARRRLLDRLVELSDGALLAVPAYPGDDLDLILNACESMDVEGLVLKRRTSVYRPGHRSRDWRKVKCTAWTATHLERRRLG